MRNAQNYQPRYDVVVVGARCAGASTAMLLARAGAKVLMVDRQKYGSDVVSTHALMRAGVIQLSRWGLLSKLMATGTPPVRRTAFHYGDEAVHIDVRPEHGVDFLCAPRRTALDSVLVDGAREAGVEVRHGVTVTGLQFGLGRYRDRRRRPPINDRPAGWRPYLHQGHGQFRLCLWLLRKFGGRRLSLVFRKERCRRCHPHQWQAPLCIRRRPLRSGRRDVPTGSGGRLPEDGGGQFTGAPRDSGHS